MDGSSEGIASTVVNSAKAHNVPVVTAQQMLTWLDGRNSSSFGNLTWVGNTLSFTVTVGAGARNLLAMVPVQSAVGGLINIMRNDTPVTYTTQTIKGVPYAFFNGADGVYQALYGAATETPTATTTPSPLTSTPTATPTGVACFGDTTAADFAAGTPDANTYIAQTGDGEVMLAPTVGAEFSGTTLPVGWESGTWNLRWHRDGEWGPSDCGRRLCPDYWILPAGPLITVHSYLYRCSVRECRVWSRFQ